MSAIAAWVGLAIAGLAVLVVLAIVFCWSIWGRHKRDTEPDFWNDHEAWLAAQREDEK